MSNLVPSPRRWPLALAALLVGAAIGAALLWLFDRNASTDTDAETVERSTTTAVAETRDLRAWDEWPATLASGTSAVVGASARGTVTRTSDVGAQVVMGDVIAELDGAPVIALYGSVPQFRPLDPHAENGADIRQLEENLVALGYDPDGTVTVDDTYTVNTGWMVERWEIDLGFENPDTDVDAGQIAFIAGPSEVTSRTAVGSQVAPGQPLLTTIVLAESGWLAMPGDVASVDSLAAAGTTLEQGIELGAVTVGGASTPLVAVSGEPDPEREDANEVQIVEGAIIVEQSLDVFEWTEAGRPTHRWELPGESITLDVDVDDVDEFPIGLEVEIELPDGAVVPGVVDVVDDVARTLPAAGQGQEATTVVEVTIVAVGPLDTSFTSGPVTIRVETENTPGATMVPVRSLIALADGGHAIEVDGRGLVAVELGSFDEGWVEITNGAIGPGETLVVPA